MAPRPLGVDSSRPPSWFPCCGSGVKIPNHGGVVTTSCRHSELKQGARAAADGGGMSARTRSIGLARPPANSFAPHILLHANLFVTFFSPFFAHVSLQVHVLSLELIVSVTCFFRYTSYLDCQTLESIKLGRH